MTSIRRSFWLRFSINIIGLPILALIAAILYNNLGAREYTPAEIQTSFQDAVAWLQKNNSLIQADHNSMLWWMLIQAAELQHDVELNNIIQQYQANNLAKYQHSPWLYLISGQQQASINIYSLGSMPDYNLHFIYAMNCNRSLAYEDIIQQQNRADFCWRVHPVSPACTTHQMMGFRFLQRTNCEDPKFVADNIETISAYIKQQSRYDFRVVDVYLQRVLMQLDSGNQNQINPRWIKRILQQQNADGGWDDFQPLLPLGNEKYWGFTSKGFGIRQPASSFHATAQGVWLMAMLLQNDNDNH